MNIIDQIKFYETQTSIKKEKEILRFLWKNFWTLSSEKQQTIATNLGCTASYISYILKKYHLGDFRRLKFLSQSSQPSKAESFSHSTNQLIESIKATEILLEENPHLTELSSILAKGKEVVFLSTGFTTHLTNVLKDKLVKIGVLTDSYDFSNKSKNCLSRYKNIVVCSFTTTNNNLQSALTILNKFPPTARNIFLITLTEDNRLDFGQYVPKEIIAKDTHIVGPSRKELPSNSAIVFSFMLEKLFKKTFYLKEKDKTWKN